jgi:hypothetical protein
VQQGLVDPNQLAITGASAGGFTCMLPFPHPWAFVLHHFSFCVNVFHVGFSVISNQIIALAALTFRKVFHTGCATYGISDIEGIMRETQKFEAHSTDYLLGPWPQAKRQFLALLYLLSHPLLMDFNLSNATTDYRIIL